MKIWINKLLCLAASVVALTSCQKDEVKTMLKPGAVPALSSSANTLVLKQDQAANKAVTFTWTPADYGYKAAQNFILQFAAKGTNFSADKVEVNVLAQKSKEFTVGDLNRELLKIVPFNLESDVEVRVKSFVTDSINPVYSNLVVMKVTPYQDIIKYSYPQALNIAGNHQGWSPATAPQIISSSNNGNYEGYINFANASPEFKMVKGNDWSAGDYGSAGAGKLGNGGANLTLASEGVYLLKANTNDMSWTALKIDTWGIIGSATPNSWGASTPMTFDAASGTYSITTNLTAAEFKFRANDKWDVNFGDNKVNGVQDGKPEYGGDNIMVKEAGNYTIKLSILIGGNYSYSIKKN